MRDQSSIDDRENLLLFCWSPGGCKVFFVGSFLFWFIGPRDSFKVLGFFQGLLGNNYGLGFDLEEGKTGKSGVG